MMHFPADGMELTVHLVVSDLEQSVTWYREVLGADLINEYGGTSAVFKILGQWILITTGGDPTPDKPQSVFAPPDDPDRVSSQMIFRVPDTRAAFDALTVRGAEFLTAPVQYDHGETRAYFRDPDGHLFELSALD
jgi:catechol 2,3-dioxygenase-like lactoylglutathione lyase family enzyme